MSGHVSRSRFDYEWCFLICNSILILTLSVVIGGGCEEASHEEFSAINNPHEFINIVFYDEGAGLVAVNTC